MRYRKQDTSNKPRHIKYHNQKLILSMFRKKDIISIAEIAKQINLSKTTVTKVINDFAKRGLVLAAGKGNSTDEGGKKPELFTLNPGWTHVIALTINTDSITGALMDLKCAIISRQTIRCPPNTSYKKALKDMAGMIGALLKGSKARVAFQYIVVGCEGIIDAANGIIHYTIHHKWGQNVTLRDDLARQLNFPAQIYVDNILRLAGYAGMVNGGESYTSQAVITTTPFSAGGSILENRQLIHGDNGFVGEFGHMIIEPGSDIQCRCGGFGCFGGLISPETIITRAGKYWPNYPDSHTAAKAREGTLQITDIFEASNQNDPFACSLMDYVIHCFSIVVHNIVLLRDPGRIVIQGVFSDAGDYFLNRLRDKINAMPFYKMKQDLIITYATVSGLTSYLMGAGCYAVEVLLDTDSLYDKLPGSANL